MNAVALPDPYLPTAPPVTGTTEVIKSYILPGNKTGVMYVSSFGGDYYDFQLGVAASLWSFQQAGVENMIIDVSNNGGEYDLSDQDCSTTRPSLCIGGYVCLGHFLHAYLAGLGEKEYA